MASDPRGTRTPTDFSNRSGGFANLSGSVRLAETELITDLGYRQKENDFHAACSTHEVVLHGKYSGTDVKWKGEELKILRESEVLAVISE